MPCSRVPVWILCRLLDAANTYSACTQVLMAGLPSFKNLPEKFVLLFLHIQMQRIGFERRCDATATVHVDLASY